MTDYEPPPAGQGKCAECSQLYGTWCDVMIPDDAWKAISPRGDEGGLLCPNCMHTLLVRAGYDHGDAPGMIMSGPMCSRESGSDYYFGIAKCALAQNEKLRSELDRLTRGLDAAQNAVRAAREATGENNEPR